MRLSSSSSIDQSDQALCDAEFIESLIDLDISKMQSEEISAFFANHPNRDLADKLEKQTLAIVQFREQFPVNIDLFEWTFAFRPFGDIEVRVTPFSIVIIVNSWLDWVRVTPGIGFFKWSKGKKAQVETEDGSIVGLDMIKGNKKSKLNAEIEIHENRHSIIGSYSNRPDFPKNYESHEDLLDQIQAHYLHKRIEQVREEILSMDEHFRSDWVQVARDYQEKTE